MSGLTRLAAWAVPDDEIDHLDHMSQLFYAYRAEQAANALMAPLASAAAAEGSRLSIVDRHTAFLREQRRGAALEMWGGIVEVDDARIETRLHMVNPARNETSAIFRLTFGLREQASGASTPLSAAVAAAARSACVEPPADGRPPSLTPAAMALGVRLEDLQRAGISSHRRVTIGPEDCDPDGVWTTRRPRIVAPKYFPKTGVMSGVWNSCDGFGWPALERRIVRLRPVRTGDVLETYEALLSVGRKVIQSGNWLFDARSGELVESDQQINAFLSFATRRAEPLSPAVRERLEALASPGLIARASEPLP
jgi:acyl-CoA thioesterase FadM